jgi:hypothetical protein
MNSLSHEFLCFSDMECDLYQICTSVYNIDISDMKMIFIDDDIRNYHYEKNII